MGEKVKLGDAVELKSGSITMTVNRLHNDGDVTCVWWDIEQQKFQDGVFATDALQAATPSTTPTPFDEEDD